VSVPDTVVTNAEIGARLGVDDDWIARRTGIHSRRVARPDERLETHATESARAALACAGIPASDVDLVIVATTTSDEIMPGTAPLVAHALGATGAGAFDVGSACTGFLSALAIGAAQVEAGRSRCTVVIGADFMSRITDPLDRATAAVFADGAGAVVLERTSGQGRIGPVVLAADGAGADHIKAERSDGKIRMRGHETFREAVARLTLCTHQAVRAAGVGLDEIDLFVYHRTAGSCPPWANGSDCRPAGWSTASASTSTRRRRLCRWRWPSVSGKGCWPQVTGCCSERSAPGSPGEQQFSSGAGHERDPRAPEPVPPFPAQHAQRARRAAHPARAPGVLVRPRLAAAHPHRGHLRHHGRQGPPG
jgi:3-oxoacyl-[acyl-carrier-protein] synthase-3